MTKKTFVTYFTATVTFTLIFFCGINSAIAKKGGSNSHGGGSFFMLTENDSKEVIDQYFSQGLCRNVQLDIALSYYDKAISTENKGVTDLGHYEVGGGVHLNDPTTSRWVASLSVLYARVEDRIIPSTTLQDIHNCLLSNFDN